MDQPKPPPPAYQQPMHTQQPQAAPPYGYLPPQLNAQQPPVDYSNPMSTITMQPGTIPQQNTMRWAPVLAPMEGVTPGMENLVGLSSLLVDQLPELIELMMGVEQRNRYVINGPEGNTVLFAYEDSDIYDRQYSGPYRAFTMHIIDSSQREVIRLVRPNPHCCHEGCCRCCYEPDKTLHSITVEAPPGNKVGSVKEVRTCCSGVVSLRDAKGKVQLKASGSGCCGRNCCNGVCCCAGRGRKFALETKNGHSIGCIERKWMGRAREFMSDASQFQINFPTDLSSEMKAVVIGATFLLHYMYFERPPRPRANAAATTQ